MTVASAVVLRVTQRSRSLASGGVLTAAEEASEFVEAELQREVIEGLVARVALAEPEGAVALHHSQSVRQL